MAVPIAAAVVLLGGGALAAHQLGQDSATETGTNTTPSVMATQSTAPPSATWEPSPTDSGSAGPSSSADDAAQRRLENCQAKVRAGDKVLKAARTGVSHWTTHVQAQTDANTNKISVAAMNGEFKKTRLLGPADQKRYADALSDYKDEDGSCRPVEDAGADVSASLDRCDQRSDDQKPVMKAAAAAMADWKSHLAAMQRSREGHVENAEEVWIAAWRAAPPDIKAYTKAAEAYDPPRC